jgi:hypothetical protein
MDAGLIIRLFVLPNRKLGVIFISAIFARLIIMTIRGEVTQQDGMYFGVFGFVYLVFIGP